MQIPRSLESAQWAKESLLLFSVLNILDLIRWRSSPETVLAALIASIIWVFLIVKPLERHFHNSADDKTHGVGEGGSSGE